jgi:cytidylate kinase
MVIAIDGPAGAGKSTVARAVAAALGFSYLDSGAMYRCVALLWLANQDRPPAELAREARIEPLARVRLNGQDVEDQIRSEPVSQAASQVAADPGVREALVASQRELVANGDWVVEGRDIASVVAPGAELKIFLTAGAQERARRRAGELGQDLAGVRGELAARDERDRSRQHSPLRPAPGAVVIDTSEIDAAGVVERVVAMARGILGR